MTDPQPDATSCPTCGHDRSAWVGGGCTVFIPCTEEEQAATGRWARECGHDCSVDYLGESQWEQAKRAIAGLVAGRSPDAT